MSLADVAKAMNEELAAKSNMKVGEVTKHPDGRMVLVKSGCFLDPIYNRVSNWWTWNEVLEDDSLGKEESGYGW